MKQDIVVKKVPSKGERKGGWVAEFRGVRSEPSASVLDSVRSLVAEYVKEKGEKFPLREKTPGERLMEAVLAPPRSKVKG